MVTSEQQQRFIANLAESDRRYWNALPSGTKTYWLASLGKFSHPFEVRTVAAEFTVISDAWERVMEDMQAGRDVKQTCSTYKFLEHMEPHRRAVWIDTVRHCKSAAEAESLAGQFMVMRTLYERWADQMPTDGAPATAAS